MYVSSELSKKNFYLNHDFIFFLLSIFGLYTIIITGERMASLMFFLTLILMFFLLKIEIKKIIFLLFISILAIFYLIPKNIYEDRFLRGLSDTIYIDSISKYSTAYINHRVLIDGFESTSDSKEYPEVNYKDRL